MEAMDQLVKDAAKAGCVMVEAGGLLPTSNGVRVRLSGGKLTVMDGPFTEAKEVIGGYAIFDAKSKAEMIEMDLALHGAAQGRTCRAGRARPRSANSPSRARNRAARPRVTQAADEPDSACGTDGTGVSR